MMELLLQLILQLLLLLLLLLEPWRSCRDDIQKAMEGRGLSNQTMVVEYIILQCKYGNLRNMNNTIQAPILPQIM